MSSEMKKGMTFIVTLENLDEVPVAILHDMAHAVADKLGVEFDCEAHGDDKGKLVTWMKRYAFGLEGVAN